MKTALTIITLGLSLWAIPAAATPARPETPRGLAVANAARSTRAVNHVDVQLRADSNETANYEDRGDSNRSVAGRGSSGGDWAREWRAPTTPGQFGSVVPEPSASTLFGVGVLLALQAVPRRNRRASVDTEIGGTLRAR